WASRARDREESRARSDRDWHILTLRIVRLSEPRGERKKTRIGMVGRRSEGALCARRLLRCLVSGPCPQREPMAQGKVRGDRNSETFRSRLQSRDACRPYGGSSICWGRSRTSLSFGCYCGDAARWATFRRRRVARRRQPVVDEQF